MNTLIRISLVKRREPDTQNTDMYNKARQNLVNTYNSEQVTYLQRQIDNIQSAADNKQYAIAWDIVNKISGRKSVNKVKCKMKSYRDGYRNFSRGG